MKQFAICIFVCLCLALLPQLALAQSDTASDKSMQHYYDDANGTDAHGGIHRNGDDFVGDGGAHGPIGPGPDDPLLKTLAEDSMGLLAGELWQFSWGSGEAALMGILLQKRIRTP